ncbi:MAG: ArsR/SmtB family transcription factor [Isosphaerales bacterium]
MAATKTSIKSSPAAKAAAAKPKSFRAAEQRFHQARRASILLKHVSDPTRLQVILILSEGERHVGALCAQLSQSQPAVSHHLALLRHGGIIAPRRQGKNNFYSLTDAGSGLATVVKNLIT